MADQWNEFEDLMKREHGPSPLEHEKESCIINALAEFDQKYAAFTKGNANENRLIDAVRAAYETIFGAFTMKKTYATAGGLCVLALTISLINTSALQHIMPVPPNEYLVDAAGGKTSKDYLPNLSTADSQSQQEVTQLKSKLDQVSSAYSDKHPDFETKKQFSSSSKEESTKMNPVLSAPPASMVAPDGRSRIMTQSSRGTSHDTITPQYRDEGRDKFDDIKINPVKSVLEEPVSSFSVDVDTSSYSFIRASLNNNVLPQQDAVRIEELINYFPYSYEAPKDKSKPFKVNVSIMQTPWNKDTKLLHIGIKGYQLEQAKRPRANLVFLLDTSGSMNAANKLPLLQNSMKLLLDSLSPNDSVAIVTYAGHAGIVLEPTLVKDKGKIVTALDNLFSGGSTAGAEGIRQAYQLAEQHLDKEGINRVILATDGDFNVGITNQEELKSFIQRKRESGVSLSVLGFGMGNYNDAMMQTLAQNGNGNAAYIDNLNEARKILVEEVSSTLFTIAKDVKIQVEFNPQQVAEYRLIGYENRLLNREDFNNDKVDAGDIGAGHTVTAIYEITPNDSTARLVDDLRYAKEAVTRVPVGSGEYAFVKIRYKLPEGDTSKLISTPVTVANENTVSTDAAFAASVAAFGQLLRGDNYVKNYNYDDAIALAESSKGEDKFGYRSEFINLMRLAKIAPAMKPLHQ